jgi:hypothetical protein
MHALDRLVELSDWDEICGEMRAAIDEGVEDVRVRRTVTLDEYHWTRGWRIIFTANEQGRVLLVVTIERRGQVYQRL